MEKYRYTNEWPPLEVLEKFSNWEHALDEEGIEGQDETTIRPQGNQVEIDADTCVSVADIILPSKQKILGILFLNNKAVESIDFMFDQNWYRIQKQKEDWIPFYETWLPETDRSSKFEMDDQRFFPMKIESRLSVQGREKIQLEIR